MSVYLYLLLAASAALYTLAGIMHTFHMFRRNWDFLARWSTRFAFIVHSLGLIALSFAMREAPFATLFEFSYVLTWTLMAAYIVMEVARENQAAGGFLVPVIAVVQVLGVSMPKPGAERLVMQEFPVSLIGWHIGVTMLGYVFFIASFVAGALYLIQERNLRLKRWGPMYYRLPSLETLDIWSGRFVYAGFPLLTLGMGAGLYFAHVTWQSFWQSDPKVIFTVFVWLVYCGYLLMRKFGGWGGRKAAWWAVAGVVGLMINYFVINLVSETHRFGV